MVTYTILLASVIFRFDVIASTFFHILGMFQSLLYAIGIAYVINVVMIRVEKLLQHVIKETSLLHRFQRGIAITLSLIIVFGLLILMFSIIVPRIIESLIQLLNNLSGFFVGLINNVDEIFTSLNIGQRFPLRFFPFYPPAPAVSGTMPYRSPPSLPSFLPVLCSPYICYPARKPLFGRYEK